MKTRTGILLALGAGITVLVLIRMKMVQQMFFGLDLVEMERTVLPAALICAAGAFVGYCFHSQWKKSNADASCKEQLSSEISQSGNPDNQSLWNSGEEVLLPEASAGSTEQIIELKESALTDTTVNYHQPKELIENLEIPVSEGVPDVEIQRTCERAGDEVLTQMELNCSGAAPEAQMPPAQDIIASLEDKIAEHKRKEEVLRTESEVLNALVENAAVFMAVVDGTGKIVLMNSLMLQSLGYTADEVIGMQFASRFIPQRFVQQVWPDLAAPTVKSGQSRRVESYVLAKDGREVPVEWYITPTFDSADRLSYCFVVGIDITERRKAQETITDRTASYKALYEKASTDLEYYRFALDSSLNATVIYDMKGNVTYTNAAFTAMFGWITEELHTDQPPFVPESQKNIEQQMLDSLIQSGTPYKGLDTKRHSKDGRLIPTKLSASLFHDQKGDPVGILVVLKEVEEEKIEKEPEPRALQPEKKQISAKDIVRDITSGLSDTQLMDKYKLTARGLQSVFQKILQANILTPSEIYGRLATYSETVALEIGRGSSGNIIEYPHRIIDSVIMTAKTPVVNSEPQIMKNHRAAAKDPERVTKQLQDAGLVGPVETYKKSLSDRQVRKASTLKRSLLKNDMSTLTSIYDRNDLLDERTVKESSEDSLVGKRKLRAKEMARDVHAGMGDTLLMEKYNLSSKQLNGVLRRMLDANLISDMQLYERTSLSESQIMKAFVDTEQAKEELN